MKYLLKLETQEEISAHDQKKLCRFVLESAPYDITVTKVSCEDQQTGRSESMNRGETQ